MTDPFEQLLAPYACRPSQSRGRLVSEEASPTRNPFQRDRDRIIHSSAFRRLKYKTQVFVYHEGDHFRTRLSHTLEVAQIARALARSLRVQEDLAEAVALAHDLGHPPFAHCGEDALEECLKDHGGFNHNDQSIRIVTRLEKRYAAFDGLNLSWEVLEGLAKHNGPLLHDPLPPTIAEIDKAFDLKLRTWASLEAQIGNLSDDIAYNNHDIDDGLRAGFFAVQDLYDLPVIGPIARDVQKKHPDQNRTVRANEIVRQMMGKMIADVLAETQRRLDKVKPDNADDIRHADNATVAFSDQMLPAIMAMRTFLMQNLYRYPKVTRLRRKMALVVKQLFETLVDDPQCLPTEWQEQIKAMGSGPAAKRRVVLDYVAGMTDRYALQEHRKMFDPYALEGLPSV
jgi:dGTPase